MVPIFIGGILGGLGGSLISGAASLLGGERRNAAQRGMTRQQMQFNAAEAEKNREFQREMSSTAHQRQVKDLRRAGLNPILSANQTGASTPAGATATGGLPNMIDTITPAVSTAIQVSQTQADIELKEANQALSRAQEAVSRNIGDVTALTADVAKSAKSLLEAMRNQFDKSGIGWDTFFERSQNFLLNWAIDLEEQGLDTVADWVRAAMLNPAGPAYKQLMDWLSNNPTKHGTTTIPLEDRDTNRGLQ